MPYDGTGLDEATKVLLEARRLVEEGWCQGVYADTAGRVCLHRAISEGGLVSTSYASACMEAYCRVLERIPPSAYYTTTHPIQDWNDVHGRTQAEVLALLDRAIAGGDKG